MGNKKGRFWGTGGDKCGIADGVPKLDAGHYIKLSLALWADPGGRNGVVKAANCVIVSRETSFGRSAYFQSI